MFTNSDWVMTGFNECELTVYPVGKIEVRELSSRYYVIEAFNERTNFRGEFREAQAEAIIFAQDILAHAMRLIEDM